MLGPNNLMGNVTSVNNRQLPENRAKKPEESAITIYTLLLGVALTLALMFAFESSRPRLIGCLRL